MSCAESNSTLMSTFETTHIVTFGPRSQLSNQEITDCNSFKNLRHVRIETHEEQYLQ